MQEWSGDALRPIRRVIGSCKKQGSDELLEITADSLSLFLQKIKICCEDFQVYNQVKIVEEFGFNHYDKWSGNLLNWRKELDIRFKLFDQYAKKCQLIFVQRSGRILGGLLLTLQSYYQDCINLTIKEVTSYTSEEVRKKRIGLGLKTMKIINDYFRICRQYFFSN